ncbi:MAG: hypothetical protein ACRDNS_00470 [Trebonia sp.]
MKKIIAALAAAAALTLVTACGTGAPAAITSHGEVTVFAPPLGGQTVRDAYPDIASGGQVTVTNSAGKVVGTGTLLYSLGGTKAALTKATAGTGMTATEMLAFVALYKFTVKVPAGLARYGIKVGKGRGTIYFSARQMKQGPVLSLGSMS